jgi:putative phosphoesterase
LKILVFSDSHSRSNKILEVLKLHNGKCDAVVFCGDGARDMDYIKSKYPDIPFFIVKGNCDYFSGDYSDELFVSFGEIKIMIAHGHKHGVKSSLTALLMDAKLNGADAVFFGHTHIPYDNIHDVGDSRIHLFNPGSIGASSTYGVINTSGKVLVTSIAKI